MLSGFYSRSNDLTTFGNQPYQGDALLRATVPGILIPTKPNTSALNLTPINRVKSGGGSLSIEQDLGFATLNLAQRLFEGAAICPHRFRSDAGGFLAIEHQLRRRYDLAGFHPGIGQ